MPSLTMERGLLRHFPRDTYLSATDQSTPPLPIRLLTYLSLWAILAVGAGERGAWGGAGGRRIPRDGKGGGGGAGGRNRDGGGAMSGKTGAETRTAAATKTMAAQARGGRGRTVQEHDQVSSDGVGGEYRAGGAGQEEIADKSDEWSGADLEGSTTEEEATTAGRVGGKSRSGRKRQGGCRKAAHESFQETRRPTGATPGRPPLRTLTRWEREATMGRGQG